MMQEVKKVKMKKMRLERLRRGWTLREVEKATGIRREALSRIERGVEVCWPGWKRKLSTLFNLTADVLLKDIELVEKNDG